MNNVARKAKEISEKDIENQNQIRALEQFYTEGKVDTMLDTIESKKEQLVNEMVKYAENHTKECKWTKEGDPIAYEVAINPIVINNSFFKPITPISSQEPIYNAEKLGMVYDYYCFILSEVNDKIGYFPSSLTSFCKLAGITMYSLKNYKNSSDINMRTIAEKIFDQISDENITLSQMGYAKERTTLFKMKSQNELVEKAQPKVSINIVDKPDFDRIQERLDKYKQYSNKKKTNVFK